MPCARGKGQITLAAGWWVRDSTRCTPRRVAGFWLVEEIAERPERCRVWFCVSVRLNKRVPGFVVSLVSRLGLKKATSWLGDL